MLPKLCFYDITKLTDFNENKQDSMKSNSDFKFEGQASTMAKTSKKPKTLPIFGNLVFTFLYVYLLGYMYLSYMST